MAIPNYNIQFGQGAAGNNPMDALRSVMGLMQFKQDAELMPLRKEQAQLSLDAAKAEALRDPLRTKILEQSLAQGGLSIEAAKREAELYPLRTKQLEQTLSQGQLSIEAAKREAELFPAKKEEQNLVNQFRQAQLDKMKLEAEAAKSEAQREQAYRESLSKLSQTQDPTARQYAELANMLPPQLATSIRENYKLMSEEKRTNTLNHAAQVLAAANSGRNDLALQMLKDRATGLENAGQTEEAKQVGTWAKMFELTPQFGRDQVSIFLSTLPEGQKAVETAIKLGKEARVAALPEGVRKDVNAAVNEASKLQSLAGNAASLAERFEKQREGWQGGLGTLGEFLKSSTGYEDGLSQLRREYVAFRSSQASELLKDLRPASDTDVAMVMKGFLSETADFKQISSYLRGMAKVNKLQSEIQSSKADWIQQVGTLGRTSTDVNIGGMTVPAGTSFTQFTPMLAKKTYIDDIVGDFKMREDAILQKYSNDRTKAEPEIAPLRDKARREIDKVEKRVR